MADPLSVPPDELVRDCSSGKLALSKPFPGATRLAALNVHLFFLKLFGCKLHADAAPINLKPIATALLTGTAHPEVSITIAHSRIGGARLLMYDSQVHTMKNQAGELHGAVWLYLVKSVAVKVGYVRAGAPLSLVGHPWHPSRPGKTVKRSPYFGGTEPDAGPGALLPTP